MKIRKAKIKDIPKITKLWKNLMDLHTEKFGYDHEMFRLRKNNVALYRKFIKKCIRAKNTLVLVVEADNKIVGYINTTIKSLPQIYVHNKEAYVLGLFISQEYRKKGLGKKLLEETEKWAKRKGVFAISLRVVTENKPAFQAYKKLGFFEHHYAISKVI